MKTPTEILLSSNLTAEELLKDVTGTCERMIELGMNADNWIELKDGCEMPDYDEPVLWLSEDGLMCVDALDKDGNPWIFGGELDGFTWPRATHWMPLPKPPKINIL